ncbi:lim and transglutaminase domain protein ltd-1-like [Saccostrea echinata]|uniref:lim and transglutaminase domain protein ltd-1-like n=1 Tax=Saccostrea echinata TaxID=191078 RepID=UPI002A802114|nr:lim and transglutaminase domain protein ltd-1-like [Saccostrea echinata]
MGGGASKPAKQNTSPEEAKPRGPTEGVGGSSSRKTAEQGPQSLGPPQEEEAEEKLDIPDYIDILQENTDDVIDIPVVQDGYPPPKPASNRKSDILRAADIAEGDKRAKKIKPEDATTFEDLAELLTKGMSRDVQQVRAIFSWVIGQNVQEIKFPENMIINSPMQILKRMKEGKSSYTTIFTLLCRAAKIPCAIIHGFAKSAGYEVGQTELENLRNMWNAVYVNGGWRFVFPLWACRVVVGHSTGKWTLVEAKGKGVREKMPASTGESVSTLNDYYFLPDAEEFVFRCFPDNPEWQLLRKPISKDEFVEMPYCRPSFFDFKVKIVSKPKCVLISEDGLCNICLKSSIIEDIMMTYELFYNDEESGSPISSEIQLDKYVAVLNQNGKVAFNIRFPSPGVYKIDVHGILKGDAMSWLCSFKLICKNARVDIKPFPCNPDVGFGPNFKTELAGLKAETHHDSFISFHSKRETEIKFTMTKYVQVQTKLVHHNMKSHQLKDFVSTRVVGNQLCIGLAIPQKGEFGLQINTKGKEDREFQNVCNYLLEAQEGERKHRTYETASEKKARAELKGSLQSKDPIVIKRAIDQFAKFDLDDKGELKKAKDKIEFLTLSKGLRDSVNRRNVEALEESLHQAKSSKFQHKLQSLIQKAEDVLMDLQKTKKYAHEILEMNQVTITELRNYQTPKPIVHDVMKATFTLLGERQEMLEDWRDVQYLMRRTGKGSLMNRIKKFDKVHVEENCVNLASQFLKPYDEDMAHGTSAGCGTFYVWANNIVSDFTKAELNDARHQAPRSRTRHHSNINSSAVGPKNEEEDEGVVSDHGQSGQFSDENVDQSGENQIQELDDGYQS